MRRLPRQLRPWLRRAGQLGDAEGIRVYAAGGVVRDLLLRRPNLDLDLAVEGDAADFARRLIGKRDLSLFVHPRFGTASIIFPDRSKIDIVTARRERYSEPVALPTVKPGSIEQDLFRRDFTINALAISLNRETFGDVIDPFGGLRDLKSRRIRVLHALSLQDDPTRMFRAVRFATRYGFRLSPDTRRLISRTIRARLISRLSSARLRQEIMLLLSEKRPWVPVARLAKLDLLRAIHPHWRYSPRVARVQRSLKPITGGRGAAASWIAQLYASLDACSDEVACTVAERLGFGGRALRELKAARRARRAIDRWGSGRDLTPAEVSWTLRGLSDDALYYLLARSAPKAARKIRRYLTRYREVEPRLTGADLQALGIAEGPVYRRILERLRDARLNGVVKTKADERVLAVRIAKRYSARTGAAAGARSLSSTREISSRDRDSSA